MEKSAEKKVRVRMAPSPTGPLHIGTARTALFNWLYARQNGGVFILRIEDTDKERSEKKYETEIFEGLAWLGLNWDEEPVRQSERTEIYKKYLKELLEKKEAYYCYCSKDDIEAQRQGMLAQGLPPKYNGHCRNLTAPPEGKKAETIRFKVPEIKVEFKDLIRGKVVFDAALFGDMIIAKDLDSPLYNFAVVVDDALMNITHVIRGEDHLSNTPKQILMQKALGFEEPIYAHIPLILNADRSKMSKRTGDTALFNYQKKGYLPEAIVNFLALLGWHPSGNEEILSLTELTKVFDIKRVQQAGAIFNQEKLDWINREYIKKMSNEALTEAVLKLFAEDNISIDDKDLVARMIPVERDRVKTLHDFVDNSKLFFALPEYDATLLIWKEAPKKEVVAVLQEAYSALEKILATSWTRENLSAAMPAIIGDRNRGVVLWPLRVALSGQANSPDPVAIMAVLGKEKSLTRIDIATKKLER